MPASSSSPRRTPLRSRLSRRRLGQSLDGRGYRLAAGAPSNDISQLPINRWGDGGLLEMSQICDNRPRHDLLITEHSSLLTQH